MIRYVGSGPIRHTLITHYTKVYETPTNIPNEMNTRAETVSCYRADNEILRGTHVQQRDNGKT